MPGVALDQDEYTERYNGLVSRYEAVKAQFDEVTQAVADKADRKKLLEQFLQAGVETEHALVTLNSALALRGEEAGGFTTVDLLQVDLFTGGWSGV